MAANCDEVQAELFTQGGVITLRRTIASAQTPMHVFFAPMTEAEMHGLDGWETYPIRRSESRESFSQILFRASGIPEAPSQGAANITMHQLLRLLYADQRTPSAFLFRYESFDTHDIREAVGDLVCGLNVYELYEIELALRELGKKLDEKDHRYKVLLGTLSREEALLTVQAIEEHLTALSKEYEKLKTEIDNAETLVDEQRVNKFSKERKAASDALRKRQAKITDYEQKRHIHDLETSDITRFVDYLEELAEKLPQAHASSEIIGSIEFTHCPACLAPISDNPVPDHCVLCGSETNPEQERSRYLQIKMDLDIQIRESRQLLEEKKRSSADIGRDLRSMRRDYQEQLSEYVVQYEISTSPRESFVAGTLSTLRPN